MARVTTTTIRNRYVDGSGQRQLACDGEGLGHQTAREVARSHGVSLDVVLKGSHVPSSVHVDRLDSVEDHVVVETDDSAKHLIKFADYGLFMHVFRTPPPPPPAGYKGYPRLGRLTVIIMPYADLDSCKKLDELARAAAPPHLYGHGYVRIEIANRDLLIRKLRATTAMDDEACRVRDLGAQIESLGRGLFPANKYPRTSSVHGLRQNREIVMERLVKAHLDAKRYGDAHDLLLLLDESKHDAVFTFYDPCRGPGDDSSKDVVEDRKAVVHQLEGYREELERKFGSVPLDQWPERADLLAMEARREFERELVDARRKVIDIVETAVQEVESIAEQLMAAGTQPSLLGFR